MLVSEPLLFSDACEASASTAPTVIGLVGLGVRGAVSTAGRSAASRWFCLSCSGVSGGSGCPSYSSKCRLFAGDFGGDLQPQKKACRSARSFTEVQCR